MDTNEEEIQGLTEGDERPIIPAPDAAPDIVPPFPGGQKEGITKPDDIKTKQPTWVLVLISVWITGLYIAFYYFLVAHWAVRYTLER
jgi:hypothetical protein